MANIITYDVKYAPKGQGIVRLHLDNGSSPTTQPLSAAELTATLLMLMQRNAQYDPATGFIFSNQTRQTEELAANTHKQWEGMQTSLEASWLS